MSEIYSTLNPNYAVDSMKMVLVDEDAIASEIENCLGINPGEHWFEPTYGSDLRRYLFDPVDQVTGSIIFMEILDKIKVWMPHIKMQEGSGVTADPDERAFYITINYYIPRTGVSGTFERRMQSGAA